MFNNKISIQKYETILQNTPLCDLHMHSTWTDGEGTVEEIILQAKNVGLTEIAITDHIRKESTYFEDYHKEILNLREKHNFNVWVGFEAKVNNFDGEIDVAQEVLKKADLSIVSVHRFPLGRKLIAAKDFSSEISQTIELELSLAALRRGGFSVLGHPGGMSLRLHKEFRAEFFEEIIEECVKSGIAFDFNSSYHENSKDILKELFKKHNPLISIGSDAHRLMHIGNCQKLFAI